MSKPAPKPAAAKSPPVTASRPRTATASSAAARSKSAVRKPEEKKAPAPAKASAATPAAPSSARRMVKASPSYEQSFVKAKTGTGVTAAPAAAGRPATVSRSGSSRLVKAPSRTGSSSSLARTGSSSSLARTASSSSLKAAAAPAAPTSSADVYGASGRDPNSEAPVPVRSDSSRALPRKNSNAAQPVQPAAPEEDEPQLPSKSPRPILKTCAVIACFNHRDLKESPYCAEHREQKEREQRGAERRASKASVTSVEEAPPVPPPDEEERQPQPEDNMQSAEADSDLVCAFCNEHFAPGTSYITALGATYHADHFRCTQCHKVLADSDAPVYSFEGKPYCEPDYLSKFAKKCSRCGKEIIGKFFRALDKDWHESCLKCNKCSVSLVGKPIYHKSTADPNAQYHEGDELYCEEDYQALYGENCAACGKLLVGKILKALDDKWHPECFCCAECQEPLGGSFFVENNNVYCRKDFENLFATRCAGCNEIVSGPCLKALDKTFHRECFVCSHCKAPLQTDKFYQEGSDVYCLKDYEQLYAIHCAGCNGLVTGTVLHVLDKDWHKECFCCSECKTPLAEGFLKKDEKVFCNPCYSRLFDINCAGCGEVLSGPYVEVLGFTWHRDCFLCTTCLKPIQGDACFVQDNRVYCSDDFKALLLATGQGGDLDDASSYTDLAAQNTPNIAREKVDYNKFSKDLDENSGKGKPAKFGRMAKIPSKARLQMRFSELPAIPEETIRRKEPAEFDLGICLARGIDATLSSGKKRIFRSDFKDKSLYKPDTDAGVFDFQDYAPCVFQALRQLYGIANESYREALCAKGNLLGGRLAGNTPAQSAPFFFSRDKRFLIRSISTEEVEFLTKIFDKYFRHVTRHPHTLLPRLFGLYEVKLPKQKAVRFVVMNNIFDTPLPISQKFDFKGSQSGRFVDETEIKAMQAAGGPGFVPVLKDQNFKTKIFLHPDDGATFKQQLGRDCSFLKACDIINHSLLVGIHKGNAVPQSMLPPSPPTALMKGLVVSYGGRERGLVSLFQQDDGGIRAFEDRHPERRRDVYFFGIIDILQEASSKRNIRFNKSAVAAMEAKKYNLQFEKFIRDLLAA